MTYEDVVNLSMNQTLARSINTWPVAILPGVVGAPDPRPAAPGTTSLQYFGARTGHRAHLGCLFLHIHRLTRAGGDDGGKKHARPGSATIHREAPEPRRQDWVAHTTCSGAAHSYRRGGGTRPSASGRTKTQVRGRTAAPQRKAPVLRPGAAGSKRQAVTATQAVSTQTAEQIEEIEEEVSDGAGDGRAARARPSAPTARAGTSGAQVHRPAPRRGRAKAAARVADAEQDLVVGPDRVRLLDGHGREPGSEAGPAGQAG